MAGAMLMRMVQPGRFGPPPSVSFGYSPGDGSGSNVTVAFTSEHDATSYVNDTGGDVLVSKITLLGVSAMGSTAQCALYADNGGNAPGALLGVTDTKTGVTGDLLFTLAIPVNVANGARVWVAVRAPLGLNCNGGTRTSDGRYRFKSYSPSNAFTDPFGASSSFGRIIPVRLSS